MGRLIDADKLIWEYENGINIPKEEIDFAKALIKQQPTAYDVDAVMEQLEKQIRGEKNIAIACKNIAYRKAIDIVKGGGLKCQ